MSKVSRGNQQLGMPEQPVQDTFIEKRDERKSDPSSDVPVSFIVQMKAVSSFFSKKG
jgi:hypothetical protein